MGNSIYTINKGVNRSIEFKGLKAQYIFFLAIGLLVLLIVFTVMYILGIWPVLCVAFVTIAGTVMVFRLYSLSNKYGEHGMMKAMAKKRVPVAIRNGDRKIFRKYIRRLDQKK